MPRKTTSIESARLKLSRAAKHLQAIKRSISQYSAVNNLLRLLAELSNIDKHRYLNITVGRIQQSETIRFASGIGVSGVHVIEHGTRFQPLGTESDRAVYVHRRYRMPVHFDERPVTGIAHTFPLDHLLQFLLNQIKTVVVPALEQFIKTP